MYLKEALKELDNVQIDNSLISEIETLYKIELSDELKKIISLIKEGVFYDDMDLLRGLDSDEIQNASNDLDVDFLELNLLPLFDTGDNDFIVYNLEKKCWFKFNIVEAVEFNEASDLLEYIK